MSHLQGVYEYENGVKLYSEQKSILANINSSDEDKVFLEYYFNNIVKFEASFELFLKALKKVSLSGSSKMIFIKKIFNILRQQSNSKMHETFYNINIRDNLIIPICNNEASDKEKISLFIEFLEFNVYNQNSAYTSSRALEMCSSTIRNNKDILRLLQIKKAAGYYSQGSLLDPDEDM